MKKTLITVLLVMTASAVMYAQEEEKEVNKPAPMTKLEKLSSKSGVIYKMVDFNLPDIRVDFLFSLKNRIRKITSSSHSTYFYQIEKVDPKTTVIASIEYSDLLMLISAVRGLTANFEGDTVVTGDYIETKYSTEDGFQIGYYISKNKSKAQWFLELDKYNIYTNTSVPIKDIKEFLLALVTAKEQIEALKAKS